MVFCVVDLYQSHIGYLAVAWIEKSSADNSHEPGKD